MNYFVTADVASAVVHCIRDQRPVDIRSDNRHSRPSMLASNRAAEMNLENLMNLLTIKNEKYTLPISIEKKSVSFGMKIAKNLTR